MNLKKIYFLFLSFLLAAGVLAGCGSSNDAKDEKGGKQGTEQTQPGFPVTVTDASGEKIKINKKPETIVSLIPSNTEIVFALGLGEKIVGRSEFDNYPEEVLDIESIGDQNFNVEKIISLNPDLVLGEASHINFSAEGLQQLKDAGITVVLIPGASSFAQVYENIEMIGKITGAEDKAEEVINDMKDRIAKVKEKATEVKEKKSVIFEVFPEPTISLAGEKTFMGEIASIINAELSNADLEDAWPQVNPEYVIEKNPDVIITTYGFFTEDPVAKVSSRPGFQDITAVKEKQIFDVNNDLVTRPGPRLAEGVEEVAKFVYPEIFND